MDRTYELVLEYLNTYLFDPAWNWPDYFFSDRSYQQWAAEDILEELLENDGCDPQETIKDYIYRMENLAEIGAEHGTEFIFMTARETAENILKFLEGGNE